MSNQRLFGRYRIERELIKGRMITVYEAVDTFIGRRVALKTIHLDYIADPEVSNHVRRVLERDAQAVGRLSHPNIVMVYDGGEHAGQAYIVMEVFDGRQLSYLLREIGALDRPRALSIALQIAQALGYAHAHGVLHRGIGSNNILIDDRDHIKIVDFGLAEILTEMSVTTVTTLPREVQGTPAYMAPEQIRGEPADIRSDLFSLAVVFYECLTGAKPFEANSWEARCRQNVTEPAQMMPWRNSAMPEPYGIFFERALAMDPALRFRDAATFSEALHRLQQLESPNETTGPGVPLDCRRGELFLGKYRIQGRLGAGGMGCVYEALDTFIRRRVAIKTIRPDAAATERGAVELAKRLGREAQAAGRLAHPNIVTIHDAGEADGLAYIVMELAEGRTLSALLEEEGPLSARRAVDIALQGAHALGYAHDQQVLHRDIKPSNMMLGEGDHLKVADFGLAKMLSEASITALSAEGTVAGTLAYMSPEQLRGIALDGRSDLFSLAAVLYECLCGRRPFVGNDASHQIYMTLTAGVPPLGLASPELEAVFTSFFERALAKDPAHRFSDAAAFAKALESSVGLGAGALLVHPPRPSHDNSDISDTQTSSDMDADHWRRISEIFHEASLREGESRVAFLRDACAGDEELWREVERLLTQEGGSFLERDLR